MLNLVPPPEILNNLAEYRRRRLITAGIFCLAVILTAILVTASLFLVVKMKQAPLKQQLAAANSYLQNDERRAVTSVIDLVKKQLRRLDGLTASEPGFTPALQIISEKRSGDIRLGAISYERREGELTALKISGVAASRQSLLHFVDALRTDSFFAAVESPVTNLIKVQNVDFALTLTLAGKK
jgi:hypothetical protein